MCVMTLPAHCHATPARHTTSSRHPTPAHPFTYTPLTQRDHLDIKVGEFVILKALRETRSEATPAFIMEVMADTVPPTLRGSIQVHSSLIKSMPKIISVTGFAARLKFNTPQGQKFKVPFPYSAWSCTPAHAFVHCSPTPAQTSQPTTPTGRTYFRANWYIKKQTQ